jgi:hypothetical protein
MALRTIFIFHYAMLSLIFFSLPSQWALSQTTAYTDEQFALVNSYYNPRYEKDQLAQICNNENGDSKQAINAGMSDSKMDFCNDTKVHIISKISDPMVTQVAMMMSSMAFMAAFMSGSFSTSSSGENKKPTSSAAGKTDPQELARQEKNAELQKGYKEARKPLFILCPVPAIASEMIAQTLQTQTQAGLTAQANSLSTITQTAGTAGSLQTARGQQVETFYRMKKAHETRVTGSYIQAAGWGATTLCYIATYGQMMATSGESLIGSRGLYSAGTASKVGMLTARVTFVAAAAAITAFYVLQAEAGKNAAARLQEIIDSLSGLGNCNPVSQTTCYCSQPENADDSTYCNSSLYKTDPNNFKPVSCVTLDLKADPDCLCTRSDSCTSQVYKSFPDEISIPGSSVSNTGLVAVKSLAQGKASTSQLQNIASNQLGAIKRLLSQIPTPGSVLSLNKDQEKAAIILNQDLGLPQNWARYMAGRPRSADQQQIFEQINSGHSIAENALKDVKIRLPDSSRLDNKNRILNFQAGRVALKGRSADSQSQFKMPEAGKGAAANRNTVLPFGSFDRATSKAQISGQTSKNIFELISHRYRTSTWEIFHVVE